MKRGGSKQKGASFEREVCKTLSLWVSDGTAEDLFWRSAMSGGRSTVAAKKGKRLAAQAGDISAVSARGAAITDVFLIECKAYKDMKIANSLFKGTGNLIDFWMKLNKECRKYKRLPMLVFKQNNFPILVALNGAGVKKLRLTTIDTINPQLDMQILRLMDLVDTGCTL